MPTVVERRVSRIGNERVGTATVVRVSIRHIGTWDHLGLEPLAAGVSGLNTIECKPFECDLSVRGSLDYFRNYQARIVCGLKCGA